MTFLHCKSWGFGLLLGSPSRLIFLNFRAIWMWAKGAAHPCPSSDATTGCWHPTGLRTILAVVEKAADKGDESHPKRWEQHSGSDADGQWKHTSVSSSGGWLSWNNCSTSEMKMLDLRTWGSMSLSMDRPDCLSDKLWFLAETSLQTQRRMDIVPRLKISIKNNTRRISQGRECNIVQLNCFPGHRQYGQRSSVEADDHKAGLLNHCPPPHVMPYQLWSPELIAPLAEQLLIGNFARGLLSLSSLALLSSLAPLGPKQPSPNDIYCLWKDSSVMWPF